MDKITHALTLPYNIKDATSFFEYSKGLLGKSLRDFVWDNYEPKKGKGSLGQMVENIFFLLETNNYAGADFSEAKFPSSTIHQHESLNTQIQYTMYSQTNSWSHQPFSFLTNIRANAWNVRCHQDNDNIVVPRLAHSLTFRAFAPF